jgi:hypothetical protein
MRPGSLVRLLETPSTAARALSCTKAVNVNPVILPEEIRVTPLMPDSRGDFGVFKRIVTDERILFTSSWIDKWFGVKSLRQKCSHIEMKLKLVAEGDTETILPEEVLGDISKGLSASQATLNRIFSISPYEEKLKEIYLQMTSKAEETGLGYYKFENISDGVLVGGGALAPISDGVPVEEVDIALHILDPKKGIGSFCLNRLLVKAFEEHGVSQVWGSSIIEHSGTPTLCARHGMMIKNQEGMKYYFIDREMWKTNKDKMGIMDNPRAASTEYGKGKGGGR